MYMYDYVKQKGFRQIVTLSEHQQTLIGKTNSIDLQL